MEPEKIVASLNAFADDIFAVFMAAAGPKAIASALPLDAEDERIIDDLMSKRAASLSIRPLHKREPGPRHVVAVAALRCRVRSGLS